MTQRKLRAAWLAGILGAASAILLAVAWAVMSAIWRSPMSRVAAFLDPSSFHRLLHPRTFALDATLGAAIGLAIALLVARVLRDERWLACVIFLSAFAAACVIPAALHEAWLRAPGMLAQPLLFGFMAAALAGFWLAPHLGPRDKSAGKSHR